MTKAKYIGRFPHNAGDKVTIRAEVEGWKQRCWDVARTRKPFAVEGMKLREHRMFCEAICTAYQYEAVAMADRVEFNPLPAHSGHAD